MWLMFLNTTLCAIPCKVHKAKFARKRGIFGFLFLLYRAVGTGVSGGQSPFHICQKIQAKPFPANSLAWITPYPNPSKFLDLPSALRNIGRQVGRVHLKPLS